MTMLATVSPSLAFPRLGLREAIAWGAAAAAVLTAHLAIAYAMQYLRPPEPADGGSPPALMIELAPMAVTPAVEPSPEPAEEPIVDLAEPVVDEPPVEQPEDIPAETIEPDQQSEAEPVEEQQEPLDEIVPDIAEAVAPDVVVPLPEPRPVEKKAVAKKPVEKAAPRKEKTRKPAKPAAVAKADARPAPKAAAPRKAEGVSKSRVSANWKARVLARVNRHKRYPAAAKSRREEGNVQVSFTIDDSGRVTSSRIARSSGSAELDRAALDMVRRASPVPAPPPEETSRRLAVPVVFNLK